MQAETQRLMCVLVPEHDEAQRIARVGKGWSVLFLDGVEDVAELLLDERGAPARPCTVLADAELWGRPREVAAGPLFPTVLVADALSAAVARVAVESGVSAVLLRPWTDEQLRAALERSARRMERMAGSLAFEARRRTLTTRERELLDELLDGATTKRAAARLGVSVKTAHAHRANILAKFGVDALEEVFALRLRGMCSCETFPWIPRCPPSRV